MTNHYLSAKEVAELLGIAESTAYAVIREWNKELKSEGYFTKAGSIWSVESGSKVFGHLLIHRGEWMHWLLMTR